MSRTVTREESKARSADGLPAKAWAAGGIAVAALAAITASFQLTDPGPLPEWSVIAEQSGLQAVAERLPVGEESPEWRDVAVFRFSPDAGRERAVCGRVLAGTRTGGTWVDFAVRVRLEQPARSREAAVTATEVFLADGPGGVRALYLARQRLCRDGTAVPLPATQDRPPPLRPARPPMVQAPGISPVATGSPADVSAAPAESSGRTMPASTIVLGRVIVRSPVNLRTGPGGAPSIGVLPRGKALVVLERAPGGWLRVGDPTPLGWVHSSLMQTEE